MIATGEYTGTDTITIASWYWVGDCYEDYSPHSFTVVHASVIITDKMLLAIRAAAKDRESWSLPVVFSWLWIYQPLSVLFYRRLMVSFSGWLAKVGKGRKDGK